MDKHRIPRLAGHTGDVASAVLEPQTYAMLLAGLGLVGFMGSPAKRNREKE